MFCGMDEYLTPKELAAELRCSRDTIYRKLKDGSLPGYRIGGQWRIKKLDLESLRTDKEGS